MASFGEGEECGEEEMKKADSSGEIEKKDFRGIITLFSLSVTCLAFPKSPLLYGEKQEMLFYLYKHLFFPTVCNLGELVTKPPFLSLLTLKL